jgi:hypothetical protein
MSKRQEKIARNKAEQQAFIKERRKLELAWLENNFELGKKMYEDNKDKMTEQEVEFVEKEMAGQIEFIANFKKEWNLEEEVQPQDL